MEENMQPLMDEELDGVAGGAGNYKYVRVYRVVRNDNLTKIAKKFDVTIAEIMAWNKGKIKSKDHIEIGWELIIHTNIPQ